jgi:hypothetical protein
MELAAGVKKKNASTALLNHGPFDFSSVLQAFAPNGL